MTVAALSLTRSLEDYRQEQLLDVGAFAAKLGITEQTYRRLLSAPGSVRMTTKRKVRDRLGVSPYLITELAPKPSPVLLSQVQSAYDAVNTAGWVVYNPATLELTGELFDSSRALVSGQES